MAECPLTVEVLHGHRQSKRTSFVVGDEPKDQGRLLRGWFEGEEGSTAQVELGWTGWRRQDHLARGEALAG